MARRERPAEDEHMDDRARITATATALAEAIAHKDVAALDRLLAPDFRLRTPGGAATARDAFIRAVCDVPAEVVSVTLDGLEIDLGDGVALVTGVQHAKCRFHGETLVDVRPFADWFERAADGTWRVRVAIDLATPD
jgi:ketosteroid isomerase-like protein